MDKNEKQRINVQLIFIIGTVLFLLFLLSLAVGLYDGTNKKRSDLYKPFIFNFEVTAKITKKYKDKSNYSRVTFKFENFDKELVSLPHEWSDLINEGDSIYKDKHSLLFTVYKPDGECLEFDYQSYLDFVDYKTPISPPNRKNHE